MEKNGKNRPGAGPGFKILSLGMLGFYVCIRYLNGDVEEVVSYISLEFRVSLDWRFKCRWSLKPGDLVC